jgi:hypothetical protein
LILHNNYNIRFRYIYPYIKIIIAMIYTKIDEFLSNSPQKAPSRPAPTTKPGTAPGKTPQRPSPIRRDKPAVDPQPKAAVNDVLARFMSELRKNKIPLEFDLPKLKIKYND